MNVNRATLSHIQEKTQKEATSNVYNFIHPAIDDEIRYTPWRLWKDTLPFHPIYHVTYQTTSSNLNSSMRNIERL
jgi:hypothetical protein